MNHQSLLSILDRPIAYHRCLVPIAGGVSGAVFLSQAVYWARRTSDPGGWFYKTRDDWRAETGLSRREQESARKALRAAGVLQERLCGVPAQLHYRVELSALLSALNAGDGANKEGESEPASWYETIQPVGTKRTNKEVRNVPTSTVITTETTTETASKEREHTPPTAPPLPRDDRPFPIFSKPKPPANGTRLPPDWFLSTELGEWALAQGMSRERIKQEADKYRDYWLAKPGAAGRKLDWDATFRNWIRRSLEIAPGGPPNGKYQHGTKSRIDGTAIDMHDTSWLDDDALEYIRQGAEIGERQRARLRSGKP